MNEPQLGHYCLKLKSNDAEIRVIPSGSAIIMWVQAHPDTPSFVLELTSREAIKIARGLIVCTERAEYPDAVAGRRIKIT